ncbi:MAG: hypothetical protein PWQ94_2131 [Thermoanaerobacterium sp.]|nr:hypothetical protein [Thermoanaerobacterium sp.]
MAYKKKDKERVALDRVYEIAKSQLKENKIEGI